MKIKHVLLKHVNIISYTLVDISFFKKESYLGENVRLIRAVEIKYLHEWINNVITR